MAISAECLECGREYQVGDQFAGRTLKCKDCGAAFTVNGGGSGRQPRGQRSGSPAGSRRKSGAGGRGGRRSSSAGRRSKASAKEPRSKLSYAVSAGVILALLVGVYFAWKKKYGGPEEYNSAVSNSCELLEEFADLMETVKDSESGAAATSRLDALVDELLAEHARALDVEKKMLEKAVNAINHREEKRRFAEERDATVGKYGDRKRAASRKIETEIRRIAMDPGKFKDFIEHFKKLDEKIETAYISRLLVYKLYSSGDLRKPYFAIEQAPQTFLFTMSLPADTPDFPNESDILSRIRELGEGNVTIQQEKRRGTWWILVGPVKEGTIRSEEIDFAETRVFGSTSAQVKADVNYRFVAGAGPKS